MNVGYYQNVSPTIGNPQKSTNCQGRLMGGYSFPHDIGARINLRAQSGYVYARVMQFTMPNAGTSSFFLDDIDTNRSPAVPMLDIRIDKVFRVAKYPSPGCSTLST